MQATSVTELMLDPLAGCLPVMSIPGNAENFCDSLLLRLRLCTNQKISDGLLKQIRKEAKQCGINPNEYIVNELLYEYRVALAAGKVDINTEGMAMRNWTEKAIYKYGEDAGLNLFKMLAECRGKRKRS